MSNPEKTAVTIEELVERYPALREEPSLTLTEVASAATLIRGDVEHDGGCLIDLAVEAGDEGTVIVVDGNLTLTAPRVEWGADESTADTLLVTGDLRAQGLYLSEVGNVEVLGNLVARCVVGCYGDNGGSIGIGGNLEAELVVAQTYFCFGVNGQLRVGAVVGDGTYATDFVRDVGYISDEDVQLFVDDVVDGDEVDAEKLLEHVVAGKPIFVNDGKPREGVYEEEM